MRFQLILLLISLSGCANKKTIIAANAISMTKTHLEADEVLKEFKKIKLRVCNKTFKRNLNTAADLITLAQKKFKADFIKDVQITQNQESIFTICYDLTGIASKAIKKNY
jgi:hypothetical protein